MTFPVLRCAYDAHIRAHIRRRATNRIADLWPSCKRMAIAVLELSCVPSLRKVLPTDWLTTINPAGAGQEGWRVTPTASEYTFYSNVANYKAKCHLVTGRRDDRLLFYFPWPADNPVPALRLGIGSDSSSAARTRLETFHEIDEIKSRNVWRFNHFSLVNGLADWRQHNQPRISQTRDLLVWLVGVDPDEGENHLNHMIVTFIRNNIFHF